MIAPVMGQETDAVDNEPTEPLSGVQSETKAVNVHLGLVVVAVPATPWTTIVVVEPTNEEPTGLIVTSRAVAAMSLMKSRETELSTKPATRVLAEVELNVEVSKTS